MITKTIPISIRIVISHAAKQDILFWVYWRVNGNWDNNIIRISHQRESHCGTNTSVKRKKKTQKSRTVRVLGIRVGKLTIWLWSFETKKNCNRVNLMVYIKVPKDKHIIRWLDQENLIYVWWNRIKNGA